MAAQKLKAEIVAAAQKLEGSGLTKYWKTRGASCDCVEGVDVKARVNEWEASTAAPSSGVTCVTESVAGSDAGLLHELLDAPAEELTISEDSDDKPLSTMMLEKIRADDDATTLALDDVDAEAASKIAMDDVDAEQSGLMKPVEDVANIAADCATVEAQLGKLTEENLEKYNKRFENTARVSKKRTQADTKQDDQAELRIEGAREKKKFAMLKKAMDTGCLEPTSYLARQFRDDLKANGKEEEYKALSRADQPEYRMKWLEMENETMCQKHKLHTKSWNRVDTTKGKYKMLAQIIKDDGGFNVKAAVEG